MLTPWVHSVANRRHTPHCLYHKKWAMKKIVFPDFIFSSVVFIILTRMEREKKKKTEENLKKKNENKTAEVIYGNFSFESCVEVNPKAPRHWSQVGQNIYVMYYSADLLFRVFPFLWTVDDCDDVIMMMWESYQRSKIYQTFSLFGKWLCECVCVWFGFGINSKQHQMITFAFSCITKIVIVGLIRHSR